MEESDWSSDVCSSDLASHGTILAHHGPKVKKKGQNDLCLGKPWALRTSLGHSLKCGAEGNEELIWAVF